MSTLSCVRPLLFQTSRFPIVSSSRPCRRSNAVSVDETIQHKKEETTNGSWIDRQLAEESLESTQKQRFIVGTSFGLNFAILCRSFLEINTWSEGAGAVSALLAAYYTADLLSGIYHWAIDNYGSKETPVFGNQIDGFQRHHRYPWTITYRQFCNNIHPVCLPAIPFSLFLLTTQPSIYVQIWASVGCMLVTLSQQTHAWAHTQRKDLPRWVQFLQDRRILVSTLIHCRHHRSPFNINYCIFSGAWNPLLDRFRVFYHLETFLYSLTGVQPRSWEESSSDVRYFSNL